MKEQDSGEKGASYITILQRFTWKKGWSQIKTALYVVGGLMVNHAALLPDLALAAGERVGVAHLDHGGGEVSEELLLEGAGGVALDVGAGDGVGEEGTVRMEEAPPLAHELEVVEVEGLEAPRVHLHEGGVVVEAGALALELHHVVRLQRGVDVAGVFHAGEVVKPVGEGEAVRRPDGVRGYICT